LNQRLQWQINNSIWDLRFVLLDLNNQLKLMIFINAAFANTFDLHNQIDYVICLTNDVHINLIHWSSIKCKRITRSILTIELYAMINDFDVEIVIKSTIEHILKLKNSLSLILLTDSKSLYDCLVKLSTIAEKRLMIDLICLRQSYERREIAEIRWIDENINLAETMTKSKSCNALIKLIDINIIELKITEWVERTTKHFDDQNSDDQSTQTIKIFDDQDFWWSNDLRNDWFINSCQSALIKLTRTKSVTIIMRQSINETKRWDEQRIEYSSYRERRSTIILKRCQCLFIDESMKRDHVLITSLNSWILEFRIRSYSRSFVLH
jgi:hypothetical protein